MKKSRFTEAQIMGVLRQAEGGMPVPELCREHGVSSATFYNWRAKVRVSGHVDWAMKAKSYSQRRACALAGLTPWEYHQRSKEDQTLNRANL
ncbi:transposase [Rhodovulum visakhapatnamense]|uniref:Transposase n=1 Tax=Rhodovulum visakhapatnamense TaxID=364297 RepID=A0A4R8F7A8_9RHOB|nr:transposase [Rhodovulum visakhapatnamense]